MRPSTRWSPRSRRRAIGLVLACVACGGTAPADPVGDDLDPAVVGSWRYMVVESLEQSLALRGDGTFTLTEATWWEPSCTEGAGTWSSGESSVTLQVTERDGSPVAESPRRIPYDVTADRLTLRTDAGADLVHDRVPDARGCADLDWIDLGVSVTETSGVLLSPVFDNNRDRAAHVFGSVAGGSLTLRALSAPSALGPELCDPARDGYCAFFEIELFHELGTTLTTGTYPVDQFGPSGLRAEARLEPGHPGAPALYDATASDPASQPWQGEVVVTSATEELLEGTFEIVLYQASATGPTLPSISVDGFFRLAPLAVDDLAPTAR